MFSKIFVQSIRCVLNKKVRFTSTSTSIILPQIDSILCEEINGKGLATFNRPKALNTFNQELVEKFSVALHKWHNTMSMIIVKGAGGKAFSAGGDVRSVIEANTPEVKRKLFRTDFPLIYLIENFKFPFIALIDGITMGGGVALAIRGKYRVATERTLIGIPETTIGFFPDAGATYYLPRLEGKLGLFLGLTGFRLKGTDVLHAGIATHYCDSAKIPELEQALLDLENCDNIENVLNEFCPKVSSEFVLSKHQEQIDKCFDAPSIEGILKNLENDGSEWAQQTIKSLRSVSPTSLKVTLLAQSLGANLSLGECLQLEYRLVYHFCAGGDFEEGVRAVLIRKDNKPKWNPSSIEEVTQEHVLSYFRPLPNNEELPIDVKLNLEL